MADVIPFWKLHHFTVTIQHFPQKLKTEKETLQNISLFEEKNLPAFVFLINIKVAKSIKEVCPRLILIKYVLYTIRYFCLMFDTIQNVLNSAYGNKCTTKIVTESDPPTPSPFMQTVAWVFFWFFSSSLYMASDPPSVKKFNIFFSLKKNDYKVLKRTNMQYIV